MHEGDGFSITNFLLCFTLYLTAIFQVQAPPPPPGGGLYLEERFKGGFFALPVWGAYIWRGLFSEFYGILTHSSKAQILVEPIPMGGNCNL